MRFRECTPYLIAIHNQSGNPAKKIVYFSDPLYRNASIIREIEETSTVSEVISQSDNKTCTPVKGALAIKSQATHKISNVSSGLQKCRKIARV